MREESWLFWGFHVVVVGVLGREEGFRVEEVAQRLLLSYFIYYELVFACSVFSLFFPIYVFNEFFILIGCFVMDFFFVFLYVPCLFCVYFLCSGLFRN